MEVEISFENGGPDMDAEKNGADPGDNEIREECGLFGGIIKNKSAVQTACFALYALQHRGQESAGIAVENGERIWIKKGMGLVSEVFGDMGSLDRHKGNLVLGHVRYSYGEDGLCPENTQPLLFRYRFGELAIAHNGNLLNHCQLRNGLESQGAIFQTSTDSELLAHFVAREGSPEIEESLKRVVPALRGGYAFIILTRGKVIGLRDPLGIRPLSIGLLNGKDYVLASETCAFDTIGAEFVREVEPGEMVIISDKWLSSHRIAPSPRSALCIFEFIYFARPDSDLCGKNVHLVRRELGRILAREHPVEADIVIGVPDSSISAASGFAEKLGLPFEMGLIKNRYIGRNFLQPSPEMRKLKVGIKLNPVRSIVDGKKVAIIDDSIVRGTTSLQLIKMVKQAGAREVHMRISSPPVISPCYYGINIPVPGELIASRGEKEIQKLIKADSLGFLSMEEMIAAVDIPRDKLCLACFTGDYPLD